MNKSSEAEGAVSSESGWISFEEVKASEVFLGGGCKKAQSDPLSFSRREEATNFSGNCQVFLKKFTEVRVDKH